MTIQKSRHACAKVPTGTRRLVERAIAAAKASKRVSAKSRHGHKRRRAENGGFLSNIDAKWLECKDLVARINQPAAG